MNNKLCLKNYFGKPFRLSRSDNVVSESTVFTPSWEQIHLPMKKLLPEQSSPEKKHNFLPEGQHQQSNVFSKFNNNREN
jgi:hypothetical protein